MRKVTMFGCSFWIPEEQIEELQTIWEKGSELPDSHSSSPKQDLEEQLKRDEEKGEIKANAKQAFNNANTWRRHLKIYYCDGCGHLKRCCKCRNKEHKEQLVSKQKIRLESNTPWAKHAEKEERERLNE